MIHPLTRPLTEEVAAAERRRLLGELRFHRTEAKRRKAALEQLEATCARVGIRLIRQPIRPDQGETSAARTDPDAR